MQCLEIIGTIVGLLYIYLEYKASVWLWLTGIIMPAIYIFVYFDAGFYADTGINIYFLFAGLYGWIVWLGKTRKPKRTIDDNTSVKDNQTVLRITRAPKKYYLRLAAITAVVFASIAYILINFTDSTVPYGDSFTTALSITGLWMLTRKYVEQWIVWIIVDIVCCGLYLYKGLYPTGALYGLYTIIAVFGYFKWLRMMEEHKA